MRFQTYQGWCLYLYHFYLSQVKYEDILDVETLLLEPHFIERALQQIDKCLCFAIEMLYQSDIS